MKIVLIALLIIHAVAHLVGFAVPWKFVTSAEVPYRTTLLGGRVDVGEYGIRAAGVLWLLLSLGFAAIALGVALRSPWWLIGVEILVIVSLVYCVLDWPYTRFGIVANVLVLAVAFASIRWGSELLLRDPDLEQLWHAPVTVPAAVPASADGVPAEGLRLIDHSARRDAPPASKVRLAMHGEIRLGRWFPFKAEQVMTADGEFVWAAVVSAFGIPIRGSDRLLAGVGSMRWKLADVVPVAVASGPDITRSAAGRLHGELVHWLPSILRNGSTQWGQLASTRVAITLHGPLETTSITITVDASGRPLSASFPRWGNPDGGAFGYVPFGVVFDEERSFAGYTIPTQFHAGWHFGTPRFETDGVFFRATIDHAEFR